LIIYGGANYLTDQHSIRWRVHLAFEPGLPFVPAAVLGYMSIYPLFWMAPFVLRSRREVHVLMASLAAIILVAGVCFVVLPVANAFPPQSDLGPWKHLIAFAKRMAMTHNWLPSLHVAMPVACICVYASHAETFGKTLLWSWSAIIAAATILLHQHYLLDVVTGYALGVAGVRWSFISAPSAGSIAHPVCPHQSR
jgi:membrane-associated phospholipid phosphatase